MTRVDERQNSFINCRARGRETALLRTIDPRTNLRSNAYLVCMPAYQQKYHTICNVRYKHNLLRFYVTYEIFGTMF